MDNDKLLAAIQAAEGMADSPELAEDRAKALKYYAGEPFGNEQAGRSQYVSRDVHNAVEGIKPSLLKIFASTDEVVKFNPTGPEDVEAAEQETAYCNYIFMQKNPGFLILESWFDDALKLKTGYVKVFWDESEDVDTERYQVMDELSLSMLLQEPTIEVVGQDQNEQGLLVEVRVKTNYGCVKIVNLPSESCKVSHNCPSVDVADSDFFEHWEYKSISWLRENGFDVDDDISDDGEETYEEWVRSRQSDAENYGESIDADPSMRMVKLRECWIRFDGNEDGKAELVHSMVVGNNILLAEDADVIPVASLSPYPLPHRHYGRSVADDTMHYQEINSYLIRSYVDNLALSNNGRYAINADRVNLSDMLVSRPGGVVRTQGDPGTSIMPLVHPQQGAQIIQGLEFISTKQENDTGITRYNQGLDADSLNKTASGIAKIMNASQMKTELIARNFAEVGVKRLFWLIHKLTKQNATKPEVIRLRNNYVPIDPRQWKTRYDMTISVGLGTGDKDQQLMHLQTIISMQAQGMQIGIATPQNLYNSAKKLTENAGFKDVENYWTDPAQQQQQPPKPSPEEIKAQAEAKQAQMELQAEQQKFQAETQNEMQKKQMDQAFEQWKFEQELAFKRWQVEFEAGVKLQIQAATNAMKEGQQNESANA